MDFFCDSDAIVPGFISGPGGVDCNHVAVFIKNRSTAVSRQSIYSVADIFFTDDCHIVMAYFHGSLCVPGTVILLALQHPA